MRLQAAAFGGTGRRQPAHTLPQTGDGTRITLSSGGARSPGRQTAAVITMITTFGSGDRNGSRCRSEASVTTGREGLRGRTLDGTWRTRTRGDARVTPYRAGGDGPVPPAVDFEARARDTGCASRERLRELKAKLDVQGCPDRCTVSESQ